MDDPELPGAEEVRGHDQRADGVVGGSSARVSEDVGVADLEPERSEQVEAGVHAREDDEVAAGLGGALDGSEGAPSVAGVGVEDGGELHIGEEL